MPLAWGVDPHLIPASIDLPSLAQNVIVIGTVILHSSPVCEMHYNSLLDQ